MIIDGRKIANDIFLETASAVQSLDRVLSLTAIVCAPNFETKRYLEMKKTKATKVGIALRVIELPEAATTADAVACVLAAVPNTDGIVLQLPLPAHINREIVLQAIPTELDPDGFSFGTVAGACLPPVVGAIKEIAGRNDIALHTKKIVVLGHGRLVGAPTALWLRQIGAEVAVLSQNDGRHLESLRQADVVVSGIGQAHFITKSMVKDGAIVFDAGTSEDGGVLVGDVHPDVADVASLFTPVPGGIGPITIACLLQNLVSLYRQ